MPCYLFCAESGAPLLAGILGAHSGSLSPTAAAALKQTADAAAEQQAEPSSSAQQQQPSQAPMRILEGPSTNPEPPLEGLSPPMARELDSNMESEVGEGALPSALYALPSELRDPPPGKVQSLVPALLVKALRWSVLCWAQGAGICCCITVIARLHHAASKSPLDSSSARACACALSCTASAQAYGADLPVQVTLFVCLA